MHAVIQSGGKQYRVTKGQKIRVEKLTGEVGDAVNFDKILMVTEEGKNHLGAPFVSGFAVKAEIVSHGRGDKIRIIKIKRRKHHMKRMGHRQWFTELKITDILAA